MDSSLNPDAPEFRPLTDQEMIAIIEEGYRRLMEASQTIRTFPISAAHDMFRTYPDFNRIVSQIRSNLISLTMHILALILPSASLNSDDINGNTENVVDANDIYLDQTGVLMDEMTGEIGAAAAGVVRAPQLAAWNRGPVLATVKVNSGAASLIGAKNIPRPQLSFKEPVDNSETLFVPRIKEKPNCIKPLELVMLYDNTGKPIGYEHPYKTELKMYEPLPWALLPRDPPAFPLPLESSPLTHVVTTSQLEELIRHLETVSEIAVDLEHHAYRSYQGITCLIQMTTDEGGDFIIDALALRDQLHVLNHSFTNPHKIKVFHGAEQDVRWLQRDFGVYVVGLFDTHQAARVMNFEGLALKHLLQRYCNITADKTYQLADWRMRPLPDELVRYARTDTHYLLYVYRCMQSELLQGGGDMLQTVYQRSTHISRSVYIKPALHDDSHMSLYVRSGKRFTRAQMTALRAVWVWRDKHARELDESPIYLVPNHLMLALAEVLPRDVQGLRALADPVPPFVNHNLDALHRIILACREVPEEPQVLNAPTGMLGMMAPVRRQPVLLTHDISNANKAETGEQEAALAPSEPRANTPVPSPWITPPTSPDVMPTLANGQKSQLNAEAQSFVPPYLRYNVYRVITQVDEVNALKEKEAKVVALGKETEVIRDEVLIEFRQPRAAGSASQGVNEGASTSRAALNLTPSTSRAADIEPRPSTSRAIYIEPRPSTSRAVAIEPRPSTSRAVAIEPRPSTSRAVDIEPRPSTSRAVDFEPRPSTSRAVDTEQRPTKSCAVEIQPCSSTSGSFDIEPRPSTSFADYAHPSTSRSDYAQAFAAFVYERPSSSYGEYASPLTLDTGDEQKRNQLKRKLQKKSSGPKKLTVTVSAEKEQKHDETKPEMKPYSYDQANFSKFQNNDKKNNKDKKDNNGNKQPKMK